MRVTINAVNAALKAAGHADVEIVRGTGYFYFAGDGMPFLCSSSVMVYHLSSFTVEEWVHKYEQLRQDSGLAAKPDAMEEARKLAQRLGAQLAAVREGMLRAGIQTI